MTHIFGYIRVSLDDQNPARQKESLANQCARFFIYFASGKDTKRPELSRILDEVRYGDMVFRHCRDSLGRSLNDLLRLTEERTQRGVTLQSIKEGLHFEGGENVTSTLKPILMLVALSQSSSVTSLKNASLRASNSPRCVGPSRAALAESPAKRCRI